MCVPICLTAFFLIVLDALYITINKSLLNNVVARVQSSPVQINYLGAILCYIAMTAGLYYFIIRSNKNMLEAFLLGVFVYCVYETTNYAIFRKWAPELVLMDTLWGGILFALTAYLVKFTTRKLNL